MNSKDEKKVVGMRADGNPKIGMGHLMRCLSIAEALRSEGGEVIFFTADEAGGEVVRERGFACKVLGTAYDHMEAEKDILAEQIKQNDVELLLVDSYQATDNYLAALNGLCPVFYMDDMGEKGFPVSGVINYNIYGEDLPYHKLYDKETVFLLGSKYAPVRAEFRKTPYEVRRHAKSILITMGGSDQLNISGVLCEKLLPMLAEDAKVRVICGRFNPYLGSLEERAREDRRLEILSDVKDMWNRFGDTDIAVAAAGSTIYELATMGVPTVCCYYVENQRQLAEGFGAHCKMVNAGNYPADKETVIENILEEVTGLMKDLEKRKTLSESMKKVTDGEGARYLALQLLQYMEKRG